MAVTLATVLLLTGCVTDEPLPGSDGRRIIGLGGPIACDEVPFTVRDFDVHHCWSFRIDNPEQTLYYLGAANGLNDENGVVIVFDDWSRRDDEYDPYYWTVEQEGDVTIFYASPEVVCFTTAKDGAHEPQGMHVSPFEWKQRRFLLPAEARRSCPSTGPVSAEELAELG